MSKKAPRSIGTTLLLACALLLSPALLQGCDLFSTDEHDTPLQVDRRAQAPVSDTHSKLRHPDKLADAEKVVPGAAGKSSSLETSLFLAFNVYEANGITRRILNEYDVTRRILQEYGITRRVLSGYGITRRVLNEYGITRRVLNQYDVTRRILNQYGITRRIMKQYGDEINAQLLADFGVTDAMLAEAGLTQEDLNDFNRLSALLNEHGLSIEDFLNALESYPQTIRLKVKIDGAHLGISIAIGSEHVDAFLEEIADDEDILFAEPDFVFDVTELGVNSGEWYDKQLVPWGVTNVEVTLPSFFGMFSASYNKDQPVHVYVLDSGAMTDSWLDDINYVEKKDFTMLFDADAGELWEENNAPDVSGFDPGDAGNPYDESGHGTHIAGTIGAENNLHGTVGIAPGVRIHSLKVLTAAGQTDVATLLAAVDYVTRAKLANPDRPIVVNLSLGVDIGTTGYNVLDEAIEASIATGVVYVVAAGNAGQDAATVSPAHVEGVITVGAHTLNNSFAGFSNYGSVVDILAPGDNIASLSHIIEE